MTSRCTSLTVTGFSQRDKFQLQSIERVLCELLASTFFKLTIRSIDVHEQMINRSRCMRKWECHGYNRICRTHLCNRNMVTIFTYVYWKEKFFSSYRLSLESYKYYTEEYYPLYIQTLVS